MTLHAKCSKLTQLWALKQTIEADENRNENWKNSLKLKRN